MLRLSRSVLLLLLAAALVSVGGPLRAQARENAMSDGEVEKLREAAYMPVDRITAYIKILDSRAKSIQDLLAKRRKPGREQEIHDLLDQFSAISDELNDNLDELAPKHRDLRKALPKLLEATERWSTTLRAPADDAAYNVVRKLALDSVHDLHEAAAALQTEQIAFFKEHPEAAKAEQDRISDTPSKRETIDIPR